MISGFDVIEREIIASLSLFDGIRISGHNLKYYYVESKKPQKNSTVLFKMAGLYGTKYRKNIAAPGDTGSDLP